MEVKEVYKVDQNGIFIEPVLIKIKYDERNRPFWEIPENCIETKIPDGLYEPIQWSGTEWESTKTPEEIEQIKNATQLPTNEERLVALENSLLTLMTE